MQSFLDRVLPAQLLRRAAPEKRRVRGPNDHSVAHSFFGTRRAYTQPAMKDLIFVGVSVGFFVVAWLYAKAFDRL